MEKYDHKKIEAKWSAFRCAAHTSASLRFRGTDNPADFGSTAVESQHYV